MKILKYIILALCSTILSIFAYVFANLIALRVDTAGNLPRWLSYFQTPDNPCWGDAAFRSNEGAGLSNYEQCVLWVRRNPAQGFDSAFGLGDKVHMGMPVDCQVTRYGRYLFCAGYWEYAGHVRIPFTSMYLLIQHGYRLKNIYENYPHPTQGQLIGFPFRLNKSPT